MKISWGWCPYHGTREKMPIATNNKVNLETEFVNKYGDYSLKMLKLDNYIVPKLDDILT